MREIKFRAWDGVNMIYPDWFATHGSGRWWQVKPNNNYDSNEYPFMQYTGLKDKNGKEIYEGDILRKTTDRRKKSVVAWDKKLAMFDGFDTFEMERIEIIGNIYENPDLLK